MSRRHSEPLAHISSFREAFLGSIIRKECSRDDYQLFQLRLRWKELAGELSNISFPDSIKRGVLTVRTSSSGGTTDFQFQKKSIEEKIKKETKGEVSSIRTIYQINPKSRY